MLGVAVAAIAGAFSVLVSWYYQPYLAPGRLYDPTSALPHWLFDLRGVAFVAWTLAAFAIGALAGMLIRRVVPAIVGHARRLHRSRRRCRGRPARRLPAGQPLLASPGDCVRRAARAVGAAHRSDRLAGPPSCDLRRRVSRVRGIECPVRARDVPTVACRHCPSTSLSGSFEQVVRLHRRRVSRASKVRDLAHRTACHSCFGVVSQLLVAQWPARSDGDPDRHAPSCRWSSRRRPASPQRTDHPLRVEWTHY